MTNANTKITMKASRVMGRPVHHKELIHDHGMPCPKADEIRTCFRNFATVCQAELTTVAQFRLRIFNLFTPQEQDYI